jgi:predicted signal transduction protein with EAL and GGDEF domain
MKKRANEIRIPIYNIEPAFIEIQARFCYKLNALSPIQVSDWTESITLNYTDFIVKYNASTLVQLDNEIYTADILKRCNDMELLISNMAERLQKIEDIKTTNSYQYKDVIVLSEYNILNKSLKEKSIELQKLNSELEIKVENRTNKLKTAYKKMKDLASIDDLTKIYNRYYFFNIFNQQLEKLKSDKTIFSLIMFDLDLLKKNNGNKFKAIAEYKGAKKDFTIVRTVLELEQKIKKSNIYQV